MAHEYGTPLIAGAVDLNVVIGQLSSARPVFHSEADFQHAFAWVLHGIDPLLNVRLEIRQDTREYVDLLCFGPQGRTAIEFKYFTAGWNGSDPATGEAFRLRHHAASDLARRNFIFDIARLEKIHAEGRATNGFAVMLSNDPSLWTPAAGSHTTRDREFRIHEGRTLTGTLRWGSEGSYFVDNQRKLAGRYPMTWREYASLDGKNGIFRWLAVTVGP